MKTIYLLGLIIGTVSTCDGQQTLREYDWQKVSASGELLGGTPVTIDGKSSVKITSTNDTGLRMQLLRIANPPVSKMVYAIMGEVKYEAVKGDGFLEMWNYFPPLKPGIMEGQYFSRTLGESGEMGKLSGTSSWRPFVLPFDRTGGNSKPTRLEINVILPGPGTVYLGPIRLVEYEGNFGMQKQQGAWWSDRTAGLIGGIGGGVLGTLASVLAMLASKGKARRFVVASAIAMIALGVLFTLAGLWALAEHQPFGVWFPLLLLGVLLEFIIAARLKQFRKGYEDLELRRMASMDA
jgi:hypothetical protein